MELNIGVSAAMFTGNPCVCLTQECLVCLGFFTAICRTKVKMIIISKLTKGERNI